MTKTMTTDDSTAAPAKAEELRRLEALREALRGAHILSRTTHPGGLVAIRLLLSAQAFSALAWAVSDSTETPQRDPLQRERRR